MADELLQAVQSLPESADPYDFLLERFTTEIYPNMTDAFWLQAHVATGLLGAGIAVTLSALCIKARKGRLHWMIHDGAATRPSPKTAVPLLWSVTSVFLITFTILFERALKQRRLTPAIGSFWWITPSILTCSYAVTSASVITQAPAVRRALIKYNHHHRSKAGKQSQGLLPSAIIFNGILLVLCCLFVGGIVPGATFGGIQFARGQQGYEQAVAVIAAARDAQDMLMLFKLTDALATLDDSQKWARLATRAGGLVYSFYTIVFFVTGLLPALALNRAIQYKVRKLEAGQTSSAGYSSTAMESPAHLSISIPLQPSTLSLPETPSTGRSRLSFKPELPQERPFANLQTSPVPQVYQSILAHSQGTAAGKAAQLRKALRRDNALLGLYFVLLGLMTSLAFYQATGVTVKMDPTVDFTITYCWMVYSFLLSYLLLSGMLMHDALYGGTDDRSVDEVTSGLAFGPGVSADASSRHPISAIHLSQTVEVVEECHGEEKKRDYRDFA